MVPLGRLAHEEPLWGLMPLYGEGSSHARVSMTTEKSPQTVTAVIIIVITSCGVAIRQQCPQQGQLPRPEGAHCYPPLPHYTPPRLCLMSGSCGVVALPEQHYHHHHKWW